MTLEEKSDALSEIIDRGLLSFMVFLTLMMICDHFFPLKTREDFVQAQKYVNWDGSITVASEHFQFDVHPDFYTAFPLLYLLRSTIPPL